MVYLNIFHPLGIDFPQYFEAVKMIFSGLNPYLSLLTSPGPWNYPPSAFLFLWWLNLFPYQIAGAIWNILSLMSLFLSIWLLKKMASSKVPYWVLVLLLTLPFFPVKHNLASGQINGFILLFITLFFYFANPIFLAYASAIKIIPAIGLTYFIVKKNWSGLLKFSIFLGLFLAASFFIVPWNIQKTYFFQVASQAYPLAGKEIYYNQSLLAYLSRSFHDPTAIQLSYYLLTLLILFLTWWRGRGVTKNRLISAVSCLLLLLPPLVWQHHYVLSIIPLILLFHENWLVVGISYLLLSWNIKEPNLIPVQFSFLLSHQFFGILILWLLALWGEKFWQVMAIIWAVSIILAYLFTLLCRAHFCF